MTCGPIPGTFRCSMIGITLIAAPSIAQMPVAVRPSSPSRRLSPGPEVMGVLLVPRPARPRGRARTDDVCPEAKSQRSPSLRRMMVIAPE